MSTEENKAVLRRFIDTFYRRDAAAFREVAAPDLAKVAIEEWMPRNDATWTDRQLGITEMMAEGDRVWARLASSGRQIGEFRGLPPTGKPSTGAGIGFMRVSGGKVVEFSALWDDLNRIQQLGGVVVPGAE
jgi:predicted ester cyclase